MKGAIGFAAMLVLWIGPAAAGPATEGARPALQSEHPGHIEASGRMKPPGAPVDPDDHAMRRLESRSRDIARRAETSICSNC